MKKPNITPGPWRILDDYYASFHNEFTPRVEDVWEIGNREEGSTPAYATSEAHAQAIAALPDLLAALEGLHIWLAAPGTKRADTKRETLEWAEHVVNQALIRAGYTF